MICKACGHEYEETWDSKINDIVNVFGTEPFVKITGTFLKEDETSWGAKNIQEIDLYACPKCGTVKIKMYD